MIIKGLFKRYERWNPVHPTTGAFWGMGIGVGCGVGWGPGFGPEVIGYVGAGCGVGFSVGFTIAGIGVGLPVNTPLRIPLDALLTSTDTFSSAKTTAVTVLKYVSGDRWSSFAEHASFLKNETSRNVNNFRDSLDRATSVQWSEVHKIISEHARSSLICIEEFKNQHLLPKKGSQM